MSLATGADAALAPPQQLLEYSFLASYTNGLLAALNELRQCAPLSLVQPLARRYEDSLRTVQRAVKSAAPRALAGSSSSVHASSASAQQSEADAAAMVEQHQRMVKLVGEVMLPYLVRCFHAVFRAHEQQYVRS